jgi:hypothetical protein
MESFLNCSSYPYWYKENGKARVLNSNYKPLSIERFAAKEHPKIGELFVSGMPSYGEIQGTFEPGKNLIVDREVAQHGWKKLMEQGALGVYTAGGMYVSENVDGVTRSFSRDLKCYSK